MRATIEGDDGLFGVPRMQDDLNVAGANEPNRGLR